MNHSAPKGVVAPLQVHVEDVVLGEGDAAEQVISLAGPLQHMQIALPIILEKEP